MYIVDKRIAREANKYGRLNPSSANIIAST
jgi:hypothetical protein